MKKMIKTILGSWLAVVLFAGCSVVGVVESVPLKLVSRDLKRASEIAEKYGDESTARCTRWMQGAIEGELELLGEDIDGLISLAIQQKLLKEHMTSNEAEFKENCGDFAAEIMLQVGKTISR